MFPPGPLGTRADWLMDIILVTVVLVPFVFLYSVKLVRQKKFEQHKLLQTVTFCVVFVAVVIFETVIRLSGGSGAFISEAAIYQTSDFRVFLGCHIAIAILTYIGWGALLFYSGKQWQKTLPGSFSKKHKRYGWTIFCGSILTASSGSIIYWFAFVN